MWWRKRKPQRPRFVTDEYERILAAQLLVTVNPRRTKPREIPDWVQELAARYPPQLPDPRSR